MMDEQRAWIRSGRRRRLRFTAALLAFSLLATNYPDIMATFSSYAQESGDGAAVEGVDAETETAGSVPDSGDSVEALNDGGGTVISGGGTGNGEGTPGGGDGTQISDGESGNGVGTPDDGDGTQISGGESGNGAGTPDGGESGSGEETPDDGDGTQISGGESGNGAGTPDGGESGNGAGTPEDGENGDGGGTQTPGSGDDGNDAGTPEDGDETQTPGGGDDGNGTGTPDAGAETSDSVSQNDGGEQQDGTALPKEDDPLADIDIDSLPDTEEAWAAYLDSLDEETRAMVAPMEVLEEHTYEASGPAEVKYAGTDGFAKRHKMRVVWINDPEAAIGKTALSSTCSKSYVCLRLPDKGGLQVKKCYFDKDILTDKSGKEAVIGEFTLPDTYADGDPFPTQIGIYSAISMLVGRPTGMVKLQIYDYVKQEYKTYYSIILVSGTAVLGEILSREDWFDIHDTSLPYLGYQICEEDAALRLKADGNVTRRFGVSMADNYGVALPYAGGGWSVAWSLRSGNGGSFPGSKYHVSVRDSDLNGVTLEAGPEAGAAELDGFSLYARAEVRYRSGSRRSFSFPVRIDSDAVRCKVQYAGADGSYIRTDAKAHNSAYTIKDLRDFPEVDAAWKELFDGTYTGTDGKTYRAGEAYTGNTSLGLFPDWKGSYVTLTLDATVDQNGQTSAALVGNGKPTVRVEVGEKYEETAPVPAKAPAGYEFAGWYSEKAGKGKRYFDGAGKAVRACDLLGDTTLYAGWRPVSREIVYRLDASLPANLPESFGGLAWTEYEIKDCQAGDTLAKKGLRLPEEGKGEVWRRGYRLEGWYTEKTGGSRITNTTPLPVEEDSYTFYARWEPAECTMTYNANGGSFRGVAKTARVKYGEPYGAAVTDAPVPVRSGYQFRGYGLYKGTLTPLTAEDTVFSMTNFTVYAVWATKVTVNLDADGGALAAGQAPSMKGVTGEVIEIKNPVRTGYTFTGWTDEKNNMSRPKDTGSHYYTIPAGAGASVTLKAGWAKNIYTVRFQKNGQGVSGEMAGQTFTCGKSASLNACVYTRTGYVFEGWNTEEDGSGTSYADRATVKDLTTEAGSTVDLYAKWQPEQYTVSFDAGGGTLTAGQEKKTVAFGGPYGELPVPTRTKYTFLGWYTGKTDGDQVKAATMVARAEGHTLYAHWDYAYFTLSFDLQGGSAAAGEDFWPREMKKTGENLPDAAPVRAGLDFGGWSRTAGGSAEYQAGAAVTWRKDGAAPAGQDTMTLYAVWTTDKPSVTYINDSDDTVGDWPQSPQLMTADEISKGEVKLSDKTPTRTGYTFQGWARTAADGTSLYQPGATVKTADSLRLYAVWAQEIKKDTVSLTLMDGSKQLSTALYTKGTQVTLPGCGLTERVTGTNTEAFKGWSKRANASTGDYQVGSRLSLNGNTTLYAVWQDVSSYECKWRASETAEWKYGTLAQADAALTAGGEAVMLKNKKEADYITLTGVYTLNLNGKTLSSIQMSGGRLTICNGDLSQCSNAVQEGTMLQISGSADVTLRDVGIVYRLPLGVIGYVYVIWLADSGRLTLTGNTFIGDRATSMRYIMVSNNACLTVEYLEMKGGIVYGSGTGSETSTVEIKDGFFYNMHDGSSPGIAGIGKAGRCVIKNSGEEASAKLVIAGGCFANRTGLVDGNKIAVKAYTNGPIMAVGSNGEEKMGVQAAEASPRYGNVTNNPENGWFQVAGTGVTLPDIWEINGNRSTKKAPTNDDMTKESNDFRLVSASGKSDGDVSWTKSGSRAAVDLNGYTYEVTGGFTMTGGMEGNNGSIGNGTLKAAGRAAFQKTHIASNMVVKAEDITLDTSDTIEAGARFYANSTIGQCTFGDVVLVEQTASDDSSYTHYYVATPWQASGQTSQENVAFCSNYPADSGQAAATKTQTQTLGKKWSVPAAFSAPTGFTFYEWNTKADGTGSRVTADVVYDSAVKEVYAVWKRENRTISFQLNGGGKTPAPVWMEGSKESGTRLIPYNYPVGNPPAAKRTGYTLEGWYTTSAATGGTKLTSTTKVTGNTTYYARWKEAEGTPYTVKYQTENGTLLGQKEFYGTTGASISLTSPMDIRQSFTGYEYNNSKAGDTTIKADGSSVVTLTYALKKNSVRVTVVERTGNTETALSGVSVSITGGGTGSGTPSASGNVITKSGCAYGSTVTLAAGEKTGYEFVEWKGAQTGTNPSLSFTMPDLAAGAVIEVAAVYQKKTYPAAYDLTDMKAAASGGGTAQGNVTHGGTLTVTLKADEGYELPQAEDITVTVGGARRTLAASGSGDTCTANGGTAALTIKNVTGAVNVTAAGVPKTYKVTFEEQKKTGQTADLLHAKLSAGENLPAQTKHGTSCTVVLSAAEGYELPENIAVYTAVGADGTGGTALTSGTGYRYDDTNGTVYLPKVTGNIRIEAGAVPGRDTLYLAEYYQMDENGSYEEDMPCETDYLTGETGTAVDVDALAGQRSYDGYTYDRYAWSRGNGTDAADGAGTPAIAADGSTVVKLYYKRNQYTVAVKIQTKDAGGSVSWTDWDGMDAAGAANPYYYRQSVDMDLSGLPDRKGYDRDGWAAYDTAGWTAYENWAKNPGAGEAPASRFRGKAMRMAIRMPDSDLAVVPVYTPQRLRVPDEGLIHVAFAGEPEAWYEQPFTAGLEADDGYSLPDTIAIAIGEGAEETVLADGDFTYDKDTGRVEITAEKVTGTITIHAEGERQERTQTVFLRYADGVTKETAHLQPSRETGAYPVTYNGRFSLALTPEKGYVLPDTLQLMAGVDGDGNGGTALTIGADGGSAPSGTRASYDRETGMLSVLAIRDDVLILIPEAPESSEEPAAYTVEHYRADGDGGYELAAFASREALAGTEITEALREQEKKNYTGYAYAGYEWTAGGAEGSGEPVVAADGSTVIKMYYDIAEYALTVAMEEGLHGGISGQEQAGTTQTYPYHYGDSIELELTKVGTGKSFKGWHKGGEIMSAGWHYAFTMPAEDLTVTAKSGAGSYELTAYGSHGKAQIQGEEEEGYLSQIAYETAKTVMIMPDEHYNLPEQIKILVDDGERKVSMESPGSRNAGDGDTYVSAQDGKSGEITLTVRGDTAVEFKMTPDQYELTLDPTGGTLEQTTLSVTYGEPYGKLPVPERHGYDFLGWYSDTGGGTKAEEKTALFEAGDHTLYAQWKKQVYEITLDPNGGKLEQTSVSATYGEPYGALPKPKRNGYVFSGWYSEPKKGTKIEAQTPLLTDADHTLYAQWKRKPEEESGKGPTEGAEPAPGEAPEEKPGDGGRPAPEKKPEAGRKPAPGERPEDGTKPASGEKPEDSTKPASGEKLEDGTKPAPEEKPEDEPGMELPDGDRFGNVPADGETLRERTESGRAGRAKCGLCHICPTFLGICYFIWLAIILIVILVVILVLRRKKEEEKKEVR